jgi:HNH endonuclease
MATRAPARRCGACIGARTAAGGKDLDEFTREGDHVIPASMGGTWIDHNVCETCNKQANWIADEIIAHDFLIRLLRSRHRP